MLDAFIIDQLRQERAKDQWEPIPLHLPLPSREPAPRETGTEPANEDEESRRGVVIIDAYGQPRRL